MTKSDKPANVLAEAESKEKAMSDEPCPLMPLLWILLFLILCFDGCWQRRITATLDRIEQSVATRPAEVE